MTWLTEYQLHWQSNEAIDTIHRSFELGGNFLDTADIYGASKNEQLIAKAIQGKREKFIIATKFGFVLNEAGVLTGAINGSKDYVKLSIERSLKSLKTDYIDLYYLHRLLHGLLRKDMFPYLAPSGLNTLSRISLPAILISQHLILAVWKVFYNI